MLKQTSQNRRAGSIRRLSPRARLPRESVLHRLSEAERETLWRLLHEPMECVFDPCFRLHGNSRRESSADERGESKVRDGADVDERAVQRMPGDRRSPVDRNAQRSAAEHGGEWEGRMFRRYNYLRYQMMCLVRRFAGKALSAAAARRLLEWHSTALNLRNEIARKNLGLVPSMVERSHLTGVDFAELISEGQMALLRSIDKFDVSRGFKFSTYACRAILTSISRAVALMARQRARFPVGYDPDLQKCDVIEYRRDEIEGRCMLELRALWSGNAAELTPIERRILSQRFGINNSGGKRGEPKTLRQVAQVFGVTKERVRQIQNQALAKLRTALDEQAFADREDSERAYVACS